MVAPEGVKNLDGSRRGRTELKVDFLSLQKSPVTSLRVLASSQSNSQTSYGYENLFRIGLTGLSNSLSTADPNEPIAINLLKVDFDDVICKPLMRQA